MSVSNKLQKMIITEDLFSDIGDAAKNVASVAKLPFKVLAGAYNFTNATAKAINNTIAQISVAAFKLSQGKTRLKDIDIKLSQMKVSDKDFHPVLQSLFNKIKIAKKGNKELYEALNQIYEKHKSREIRYYADELENSIKSKNQKKESESISALQQMIKEAEKDSRLMDMILDAISDYKDSADPSKVFTDEQIKKQDLSLSQMKLDDPKFHETLDKIAQNIKSSSNPNKDLIKLYEKHKGREIDHLKDNLMSAVKSNNKEEALNYYSEIIKSLDQIDPNSKIYDEITNILSDYHDIEHRNKLKTKFDSDISLKKQEEQMGGRKDRSIQELMKVPVSGLKELTDTELEKLILNYQGVVSDLTDLKTDDKSIKQRFDTERMLKIVQDELKTRGVIQ